MNNNSFSCSARETFFIVLILTTNKIITNSPLLLVRNSGTGAPLSALLSGLLAIALIYFLTARFHRKRNRNILCTAETLWGKAVNCLISLILVAYLFASSLYLLTEVTNFSKLIAFPTTPFWFVAVFFVVAAAAGAANGGKGLCRTAVFIAGFFLASLLVVCLSPLFQSDFTNLAPVLGTSAENTLFKGLGGISQYRDIVLLLLLEPDFSSQKSARRTVTAAASVGALFNFLLIFAYTAKVPYPISAEEQFPAYLLLKEVSFGRFFQRLDAIFLLASALCGMFSLALNIKLISAIFRRTFGIKPTGIALSATAITLFSSAIMSLSPSPAAISAVGLAILGIFALWALFIRKERSDTL